MRIAWRTVCLSGVLMAVLAMPCAFAQPAGDGPGPDKAMQEKGRRHMEEMFEKLGLSKEQKAALDENRVKHHGEFKALMEKTKAKRDELRTALETPELDMAKVTAIHNELKMLMAQTEDQHLNAILEVRKILTAEQFAKFQAMMPERKGPPHEKRGKRNKKKDAVDEK